MRIGEVAARAGVNIQTLRYYERRGLLAEPGRVGAGYRAYPPDAVQVVRFIKRAQRLGFSLLEVSELLGLADGGPASCTGARTLAAAKIAELDQRIEALQSLRTALGDLVETCHRPRLERTCPLLDDLAADA